jgi:hypothetical protein
MPKPRMNLFQRKAYEEIAVLAYSVRILKKKLEEGDVIDALDRSSFLEQIVQVARTFVVAWKQDLREQIEQRRARSDHQSGGARASPTSSRGARPGRAKPR